MPKSVLNRLKANGLAKMVTIREATTGDINAMSGLLNELFSIESDFTPDIRRQRQGLADLMQHREATLLVATVGNDIVGMCSLQPLTSTAEGGRVGLVEDLVVAANYRNTGVGRKLLRQIETIAEKQGMSRLQLLADRNNEAAEVFYDHLGWRRTNMIAYRKKFD